MNQLRITKQIKLLVLAALAVVVTLAVYGVVSSSEDSRILPLAEVGQDNSETANQTPASTDEETAARSTDTGAGTEGSATDAATPAVDLSRYRAMLPRDAIRPVYEPIFAPGKPTSLDPGELVIGVEIGGESKAYPVGPLNYREMVNDVVGGVPVLVTW